MNRASPILTVSGIHRRHAPGLPDTLKDLSFEVLEGEMFALLGPSGCGKTSLLRVLAGFDAPDSGRIEFRGRILNEGQRLQVPTEKRGIGFVFQDNALFPHLTVAGNVGFGLKTGKDRPGVVSTLLDAMGLSGLDGRYPHELSGGQQQRVAIARSVAARPGLILLDEPFSNLDARLRQDTRAGIKAMLQEFGITAIMVTHDREEALSFADRIAVMRDGHILQTGSPEGMYNRPRTPFVAQFLGLTNLLLADASGEQAHTPMGRIDLSRTASGPTWISLRPEHLALTRPAAHGGPTGLVARREFKGHDITFTVRIGGADILVHTDNREEFAVGDHVGVEPLCPAVVLHDEPAAVCP